MSTIAELMVDKQPGEIVVHNSTIPFFKPFFESSGKWWYGLLLDGSGDCFKSTGSDWSIKRPTKTVYQWRYRTNGEWTVFLTLIDEVEAARRFKCLHEKMGTGIEVEA